MLWKIIVRYVRPHWPLLVGVLVFQFGQAMASLYLPTLTADIIDKGIATGDNGYVLERGLLMLAASAIQVVFAIIAVYFAARLAMAFGRDLRSAVFHRVSEFSEREVSRFGAPSLITRSTNDVQQVQMLVLVTGTLLVAAPILAIGGILAAASLDLQLVWVIAVSVPVLLIAIGFIVTRTVPLFRLMQKRIDNVNRVLREQLMGIRVVRAFVREDIETARFDRANVDVTQTALQAGRMFALVFPVVVLIMNVSSVGVIWFGAFHVQDGTMQVGTVFAFLSYLIQILMAVMMSTFMAIMIPRAAVSGDRIGEVLETESSVVMPTNGVTELRSHGTVELRDASFAYPGAEVPVLRNLDLTIEAGKTTAIIGSTGAGKTTLINLLPRLFDATGGSVVVDGVDVRELDPDVLWSRIAFVPQKPYLFSGTIASNLRYGKTDATDDELWRALDIAQGKDFVEEMDGQLEAAISQGGTTVSGGQRQRLAIARAIVKGAEIYIFDDSFSALDLTTDAKLRASLKKNMTGATMIIVAQRVSTITDADQIIVLEDGEIVGRGTHKQLLGSNPTYTEIVESQLAAEEVA
jgi:ATP-binding cassette, subfamily B, multidrug efflux pump